MSQSLVKVDFHGDELLAVREGDEVFVALKPICDRLSLHWGGQLERIKRDRILGEGIRVIRIPTTGGDQETAFLPLKFLSGWMFGIDDLRIEDEIIVERVLVYKRECYDVLHNHFYGKLTQGRSDALSFEEISRRLNDLERGLDELCNVAREPYVKALNYTPDVSDDPLLSLASETAERLSLRYNPPPWGWGGVELRVSSAVLRTNLGLSRGYISAKRLIAIMTYLGWGRKLARCDDRVCRCYYRQES